MKQKQLLESLDHDAIVRAIGETERRTSAEVRIHVQPHLGRWHVRTFAEKTFERLGMTKTEKRNGVLILLAAKEQQFAVIGDRGIHEKVGDEFWLEVARAMERHFQHGEFTEGLVEAVKTVGDQLATHFPWEKGDVNELSDAVSVGEDHHLDHDDAGRH